MALYSVWVGYDHPTEDSPRMEMGMYELTERDYDLFIKLDEYGEPDLEALQDYFFEYAIKPPKADAPTFKNIQKFQLCSGPLLEDEVGLSVAPFEKETQIIFQKPLEDLRGRGDDLILNPDMAYILYESFSTGIQVGTIDTEEFKSSLLTYDVNCIDGACVVTGVKYNDQPVLFDTIEYPTETHYYLVLDNVEYEIH